MQGAEEQQMLDTIFFKMFCFFKERSSKDALFGRIASSQLLTLSRPSWPEKQIVHFFSLPFASFVMQCWKI